ncbi:ImmA/IrrE family metallo-endopeptidase [Streptococcus danieliae]|uniref:ImmA/IrrE family metallo-endopeptidase n=1 Tax=Streptococcus danieliae TaxID=747656 RepID=A0A7Z0LEF4_9STRE|nr:ImmA/IrrE family metallo-endopeptidase [Streptococcus danieliae]MBF0717761.1 ImmA/IrrE family metallo-endopeptidase [Streptococcus danieliae]NYS49691.1 ImmA/IrrE family metallo-endopeptidase [Streptococcus danieliae]
MTEKELRELLDEYGISVEFFEGEVWDRNGVYISGLKTMFLHRDLSGKELYKTILHEFGHKDHSPLMYLINSIKCENEANRNMIHHLLRDALSQLEDTKDFNPLKFMEYYDLKTMTDEIMVMEEYQNLIND